ncbi:MAGE-domain-containing protein [Wallemia mellicola]|uniref:MAGE-domain-containing protein n=1 Tax=Wallemia mellicola TaxID=1708541 RepID=A0A4T0QXJ6_9BASI|nr:MAGE-domain-containing protein [Wallemia mellicola]TIC18989.1 MAGE-domain-containing protein [Wallemia mellicola]TIC29371.1 MAGE-domain-containing protein [Wallemia mellicola]
MSDSEEDVRMDNYSDNITNRKCQKQQSSLVRLALSAEGRRTALRKDEITKKCNISGKDELLAAIDGANDILRSTFGYELRELPPKESAKLEDIPPKTGTRAYALINTAEQPNNQSEAFSRHENIGHIGILHSILAIIYGNGGIVSDVQLTSNLKKLGISKDQPLPGEGRVFLDSFLSTLSRQNYLEKKKSNVGNHDYEYSWGSRAIVEIGENNISRFILEIINKSRNSNMNSEAAAEIDKKILDDLQRGVGHKYNS